MGEQCRAPAASERIQRNLQAAGLLHHPNGILIGLAIFAQHSSYGNRIK